MKFVVLIENTAPEASCLAAEHGLRFKGAALVNAGDGLVRQGSVEEQERRLGLDPAGLARRCENLLKREGDHEKTTA